MSDALSRSQPRRAWLPLLIAIALIVVYGVRASTGIVGGVAHARGSLQAGEGRFRDALATLEWAVNSQDPAAMHWLRGEVRHGLWTELMDEGGRSPVTDDVLVAAFNDYTQAVAVSPASGWYVANLAELYQECERQERAKQPTSLELLDLGPWALVGRSGRVAIGLSRIAIQREANTYGLHDELALIFDENGLEELTLDAVREAARIQPIYYLHPFRDMDPAPTGLLAAFAEGSRAALGQAPLLERVAHLTALGRVEILRGEYVQAEADLRAALEGPIEELNRAEANFYLGSALMEQGRFEDAWEPLESAAEHPNMRIRSISTQALIAERTDRPELAMDLARELFRLEPRNLVYTLELARLARQAEAWDRAEDALIWARQIHPQDLRVRRELVRFYIQRENYTEARRALTEFEEYGAEAYEVRRLRDMIATARRSGSSPG